MSIGSFDPEGFPPALQAIPEPPETLFFRGKPELLERPKVAIVGSRRPTAYTRTQVHRIASLIAGAGGVVVSGGALGTDGVAHQGAGNATIAVFANSLDAVYPKTNKKLIETIYENALALSEHAANPRPKPYDFIRRNRIVTGLADAVVVAQADLSSGSMHSARFALAQGRPLYVLPHRAGESDGTNELLAAGKAKAIYSPEAFLEEIGLAAPAGGEEDPLLAYCAAGPSYDDVLARFGDALLEYELEGKVEVSNGKVRVL